MHYFILLLLASSFYASEGEQPVWVRDLALNRPNVYVGIGFSSESKEEAADNALKEFSSSIKVTIDAETNLEISEETEGRKSKATEKYSSESKAITEEKLRGVSITEYWQGDGAQGEGHYILVVYDRDEYHANNTKLISEEIKRNEEELALAKQENRNEEELLRQEMKIDDLESQKELALAKQENRNEEELLRQEMEMDDLESEKELRAGKNKQEQAVFKEEERDRKREQKNKREQRKRDRIEKLKKKYPKFPEGKPPYRLIDSFAGESSNNTHSIIVKGTIKPALINEFGYTYHWKEKKFNVSIDAVMDKIETGENEYDNHFDYMKNHIKFDFFGDEKARISGSLGLAQYIYNDDENNQDSDEIFFEHSFFMSANYGFWGYLTDIGGYIDKESVYLNLIHYPLYNQIQEQLAIILELNCLFDERLRDDPDRKYGIQFGLLFKTTDKLTTKFTIENYEDLMLAVEFDF